MIEFLCGVITGLIIEKFLPADVINNYANKLKVKKSVVTESEIDQTTSEPEPKKRFKLFRKRKKV